MILIAINTNCLFETQAPDITRPTQRPLAPNHRPPMSASRQSRRRPKRRRTSTAASAAAAAIRTRRAPLTSIWSRSRSRAATIVTRSAARAIISSAKTDILPAAAVVTDFRLLPELIAFTFLLIAIRRHVASPTSTCPYRSPRTGSPVA